MGIETNWLFFALLAPLIYAIVVDIDKYILEKEISDYRGMPIYSAIVASIVGLILWIITGFPLLNFKDSSIIILTGMLTIWGLAFYFKALRNDEASRVTILFQLIPVMVLILSYLILDEKLSATQFIGFLLILFATIGVSFNKKKISFKLSSSFYLIFLTDLLWASAYVLFKFVVDNSSFYKVISFEGFGIGLGGLTLYCMFPSIRTAFIQTNKKVRKRVLGLVFINEGIFVVSRFCIYLAISLGPVALVKVVEGTQVFFAIFYGWLFTVFAPKIVKENISKDNIFKKILFGILILLGLWIINI